MDMDFQGIPDLGKQTLESRVAALEEAGRRFDRMCAGMEKELDLIEGRQKLQGGAAKPKMVREEPDDARRKPLVAAVEKIQETDATKS